MQETQETLVQSLCWEDRLEEIMATHSSILAWRIPWTEGFGGLQFLGPKELERTDGTEQACTHSVHKNWLSLKHCEFLYVYFSLRFLSLQTGRNKILFTISSLARGEGVICRETQGNMAYTHAQSCLTLWDPKDCSLPGSSVHGIIRTRITERVEYLSGLPLSRGSSRLREIKPVSVALAGGFFTTEPSDKPQGILDLGIKTDSHPGNWRGSLGLGAVPHAGEPRKAE